MIIVLVVVMQWIVDLASGGTSCTVVVRVPEQISRLIVTFPYVVVFSNGSKEVIDEYLDQTKAQVVESEILLRSVLDFLHLKPLPPLQGKL
jgi:hypothetical protein